MKEEQTLNSRMSLTAYVNQLPNTHRASIEYDELIAKLNKKTDCLQLHAALVYTSLFGYVVLGAYLYKLLQ
jgi:hypothetical protein